MCANALWINYFLGCQLVNINFCVQVRSFLVQSVFLHFGDCADVKKCAENGKHYKSCLLNSQALFHPFSFCFPSQNMINNKNTIKPKTYHNVMTQNNQKRSTVYFIYKPDTQRVNLFVWLNQHSSKKKNLKEQAWSRVGNMARTSPRWVEGNGKVSRKGENKISFLWGY